MFQIPRLRSSTQLRPLTTAHLAQTMALLELTSAELDQRIETELARNPALELRDSRRCPTCGRMLIETNRCPACYPLLSGGMGEPIVFISPVRDFVRPSSPDQEDFPEDNLPPAEEDLPTYIFKQISLELPPEDRLLAAYILSNLNEDGLLEVSVVEIAHYHHVPLSRVEGVIHQIQRADPVGVGSPSSQEALIAQLEVLAEFQPVPAKAIEAIQLGMDLLSRHQYSELGRLLDLPTRQVEQIAHFISENLNPFPARAGWGDIRHGRGSTPPVYSSPDTIITCLDNNQGAPLMVEVISPYAGMLRVNTMFRQAISQAPEEKNEQWKSDLEKAELLVKCLQQRTNTMVRLMSRIAVLQRDYILNGDQHLLPLTRASLADELEVHESTISRAVANKSVQLPNGHIVPLAKFFDRSLNVRTALKQIIQKETSPLSDTELVTELNSQGYSVARRTVAKYRAMEGILPSHLRQANPALEVG